MKQLYLVVLLCLGGCTANQSAIPFPEPYLTPTGTGLPDLTITGDAEPERPAPSPNKRILPPTKEPGVWAADGRPQQPRSVIIGAAEVPYPAWVATESDRVPMKACAESLNSAFGNFSSIPWRYVNQMNEPDRRCLAAKLLLLCAKTRDDKTRDTHDPAWKLGQEEKARLLGTRRYAETLKERWCRGDGSSFVQDVEQMVRPTWVNNERSRLP